MFNIICAKISAHHITLAYLFAGGDIRPYGKQQTKCATWGYPGTEC